MNPAELANIAELERSFWWYSGMQKILFGLLDPVFAVQKPKNIFEAGCGTGYMSRCLEQRYQAMAYPADLAWQAIEYTRGTGVHRVAQADITALPYADQSFDCGIALDVLVHLKPGDEGKAVSELARVLRPGGLLTLRAAAFDILRSKHSEFIHEFQRFTRKRLVALLANNGFEVIRCTYANTLLLPVALAKFRIWEPLARQPATSGVSKLSPRVNRLLEMALNVENRWLQTGRNLPLGQSVIAIARKRGG